MSIDGQNIDYETLRAEQATQCNLLTDLECQRIDTTNMQTFTGTGEPNQMDGLLDTVQSWLTNIIPEIRNQFADANIATLASEFNNVLDIGKPS
jgi:hypothetical protein